MPPGSKGEEVVSPLTCLGKLASLHSVPAHSDAPHSDCSFVATACSPIRVPLG